MKGKLGVELNGKKGKLRLFNQQTGRWAVELEGSDLPMNLLEANLQLVEVRGP